MTTETSRAVLIRVEDNRRARVLVDGRCALVAALHIEIVDPPDQGYMPTPAYFRMEDAVPPHILNATVELLDGSRYLIRSATVTDTDHPHRPGRRTRRTCIVGREA